MSPEFLGLIALVAVLSVVQSVFGMGLLLFGTPILVVAGIEFTEVLKLLVPASVTISMLQVFGRGSGQRPISGHLYRLCLPGIAVGLWLAANTPLAELVNLLIGALLLVSALIRSWGACRTWLAGFLFRHTAAYHLIMGLTHGLTNLGGALLAVLAGSLHKDKLAVRYVVAHYYLAFGVIQLAVLLAIGHAPALASGLPLIAVAGAIYLLVGERVFLRTSDGAYQIAMTAFIAVFGAMVLLRS